MSSRLGWPTHHAASDPVQPRLLPHHSRVGPPPRGCTRGAPSQGQASSQLCQAPLQLTPAQRPLRWRLLPERWLAVHSWGAQEHQGGCSRACSSRHCSSRACGSRHCSSRRAGMRLGHYESNKNSSSKQQRRQRRQRRWQQQVVGSSPWRRHAVCYISASRALSHLGCASFA